MNPLQKAAVRRKLWYLGVILGLFTVSMYWRGTLDIPLAGKVGFATALAERTIKYQATRHELRELEQGDPEILGTVARLLLTGSRGFAMTALWYNAIDQQKRNDFHKFEQSVKAVTTLQPHFITPWIFQSWNIAYNVSVEMQSMGDMYFYIARGIELLSEGERRNKKSPDMRYQIGFYYQNKFGVADQVQTLRCLYDLSNIPTGERNPADFLDKDGGVDLKRFQTFCEKNPLLVRRLRGEERRDRDRKDKSFETLRARTPADVVDFLRTNYKVPSRFRNAGGELADPERQFPALPPKFDEGRDEASAGELTRDPAFTGFMAARAWFAYANTLVPPNPKDANDNPLPASTPRPGEFDQFKYRVPRLPMLIIFRQGPPRAQSYQAEMLTKDGWFDKDGWDVDGRVDESSAWFAEPSPGGPRKRTVVIGTGRDWSREAWEQAAQMWRTHGENYGQLLDAARLARYREDARIPLGASDFVPLPPEITPDQAAADPAFARRHAATTALFFYHQNRTVTNFPYYLANAQAEARADTVRARKTLFEADQSRRAGNRLEAIRLYKDGLEQWKSVLLANPAYHRPERFDRVEEETFEFELDYLRLLAQDDRRVQDKALEVLREGVSAVLPFQGARVAIPVSYDLKLRVADEFFSVFGGTMPTTLTDGRGGTPWIRPDIRNTVLGRQGVVVTPPSGPGTTPTPGQP
ncbi:hypothetical protein [Urbifossiella limnaea]|uniref:Uncharacterized protein n=1 Tax=Urbifossiella limnaea TaxID=2528023 RepID=A0A517XX68_9BACT|nr:hypothetical protein [Urbifossiella limnaea]QDU22074.1 hypothetical protein ETAA1_40490 [Urbifossiella limnaea]